MSLYPTDVRPCTPREVIHMSQNVPNACNHEHGTQRETSQANASQKN